MTTRLPIDKAGRVVIPKPLQEELDLGLEDSLVLHSDGGQISLRPVRAKALIKKEYGVWVYLEPATASIPDLIDRSARDGPNS